MDNVTVTIFVKEQDLNYLEFILQRIKTNISRPILAPREPLPPGELKNSIQYSYQPFANSIRVNVPIRLYSKLDMLINPEE